VQQLRQQHRLRLMHQIFYELAALRQDRLPLVSGKRREVPNGY
jgi:hypothetical protein